MVLPQSTFAFSPTLRNLYSNVGRHSPHITNPFLPTLSSLSGANAPPLVPGCASVFPSIPPHGPQHRCPLASLLLFTVVFTPPRHLHSIPAHTSTSLKGPQNRISAESCYAFFLLHYSYATPSGSTTVPTHPISLTPITTWHESPSFPLVEEVPPRPHPLDHPHTSHQPTSRLQQTFHSPLPPPLPSTTTQQPHLHIPNM